MISTHNVGVVLVGILVLVLVINPVSGSSDPISVSPVSQIGLPSSLPIHIPEGVGAIGEDGNLHVNLVDQPSTVPATVNTQSVFSGKVAGTYQDKTMKKTAGVDGSLFEGGADIDYTVSPDNSVSGTVAYKFIEQGWTIKVKGTVSGQVTPKGDLILTSHDASVRYAGNTYPISMNVDAQYNGDHFEGTKVISAAGVTGTLGFSGVRV